MAVQNRGEMVLQEACAMAPEKCGVYRFFGKGDTVLYVGKAKNIKNRLETYYRGDRHCRMNLVVSKTESINWILCNSESEALLLEAEQIKSLQPKYNILLKDDKTFLEIYCNTNHEFPAITVHRGKRNKDGKYFGPFASKSNVYSVIEVLQKNFMIRNCSDYDFAHRLRPCLQYQIKRCTAPCVKYLNKEEYCKQIDGAIATLEGDSKAVIDSLSKQMYEWSEQMEYSRAATFRDRIKSLNTISAAIRLGVQIDGNCDIIALINEGSRWCFYVLCIRGGNYYGDKALFINQDAEIAEVMPQVVMQFYQTNNVPDFIITNNLNEELIGTALSALKGSKIKVYCPQTGEKKQALDVALMNCEERLRTKLNSVATIKENLQLLKDILRLNKTPKRIEVFDNSHIMGTNAIGAMIVATVEGLQKNQYRKFNFTNIDTQNDYAMMQNMLERRLASIANIVANMSEGLAIHYHQACENTKDVVSASVTACNDCCELGSQKAIVAADIAAEQGAKNQNQKASAFIAFANDVDRLERQNLSNKPCVVENSIAEIMATTYPEAIYSLDIGANEIEVQCGSASVSVSAGAAQVDDVLNADAAMNDSLTADRADKDEAAISMFSLSNEMQVNDEVAVVTAQQKSSAGAAQVDFGLANVELNTLSTEVVDSDGVISLVPDLWIIDGGIGHLNIAKQLLRDNFLNIEVIAIAKGPNRNAGNETIYLSDGGEINLPKNHQLLFYLQNLRDEAHRFAISSHRKKRNKDGLKSAIDDISGIGAKKKRILLQHFGSVEALHSASVKEIALVDGIGSNLAKEIFATLHSD